MGQVFTAWRASDWAELQTSWRHHLTAVAAVLAGLNRLLPDASWHLKGSASAVGWIGPTARMPNDVDLAVSRQAGHLLLAASELPVDAPGDQLAVLRSEPVVFSRPDRADVRRVLVRAVVGGTSEHITLNVLLVGEQSEQPHLRTALLGFPNSAGVVAVPSTTFSRGMAQKVLRYTKQHSDKANTRWVDLMDLLLAAACPIAPTVSKAELRQDVAAEFEHMGRQWPDVLPSPPKEWLDYWDTAVFNSGVSFGRLPMAAARLEAFWMPVLSRPVSPYGPAGGDRSGDGTDVWSPSSWQWRKATSDGLHQ